MTDVSLKKCETKLKSLSDDFELFAHITSHDLRDPLRQVIIYFDELKNAGIDKSVSEKIENSRSCINEVLQKVGLLREYSYIANSKAEHKKTDFNSSLKEAMKNLDAKIKKYKAEITSEKLPSLDVDNGEIVKLLSCLIDNSLKFRSKKSPKIKISAKKLDKAWQFDIQDNGIGIDEVYRNFVFALFQRINPENKEEGFGAGLSFCKKIVENHGGDIWFSSDGENGTCFHFTIAE